ncbi:lipoprotein [Enterobacteriaceae bacterium ESL0689]|nr:lipoprotein [Enterobacteriaceae bacterium ESL0689]
MKKILIAVILIINTLLIGCDTAIHYAVSEQAINDALQKRHHFTKDIQLPGLADAHFELHDLTSAIGREAPDKIILNGTASLDLKSLLGRQSTTLNLKLQALPVFDKTRGAIFLRDMELIDMTLSSRKLHSVGQTLLPYLNQSLRSYFNQHPAYVLREDASTGEALAKKLVKNIEVKPGEIIISLLNE